jgi:hypothetical protein
MWLLVFLCSLFVCLLTGIIWVQLRPKTAATRAAASRKAESASAPPIVPDAAAPTAPEIAPSAPKHLPSVEKLVQAKQAEPTPPAPSEQSRDAAPMPMPMPAPKRTQPKMESFSAISLGSEDEDEIPKQEPKPLAMFLLVSPGRGLVVLFNHPCFLAG